jgi:hypothetical protein
MLRELFFGRPKYPDIPNLRQLRFEELPDDGLTMGVLNIGKQGSGKSTSLALHRVEYDLRHLYHTTFSLDSSGSYTDDYLAIASSFPEDDWRALKKRIVYTRLGDTKWVLPLPEFSLDYGSAYEEQIERVVANIVKLQKHIVEGATLLGGGAAKIIAPNIFRLLTAMSHVTEFNDPWQLTEAEEILNQKTFLAKALSRCRESLDASTRKFLSNRLLNLTPRERELRTYTLNEIFSEINSNYAKAHLGYFKPAWTPKEAIEKGLIVLIDGRKLINQKMLQHYIFTQIYSLIMEQINKRDPHDPRIYPVAFIVDEVKSILKMSGMAEEVGEISPLYRSRKLQFYVVIQALSQLDDELEKNIWLLGNIICFGLANKIDAEKVSKQLFQYDPRAVKLPPVTDTQNPVSEPEHGQDRSIADWITILNHRECIIRRYESEKKQDRYIRHIEKTRDAVITTSKEKVEEIKDELLRQRAVSVHFALEVIARRRDDVEPQRRVVKT